MRFNGWICSFVIALGAASANAAAGNGCIQASEMQEIAGHFQQFQSIAAKGDYCFDDSPTSHLLAGIMFMRKTQFASDMPASPDELFQGAFKNDWYGYLTGRISEFAVEDSCPANVVAYVTWFGTAMHVCPLALTSQFTALDRASVFMHEARHIDGYPHITCSRGPRAGLQGACDRRISEQGSYAVTVETYAQISKYGGDLHPAMRAYARTAALLHAEETFDQPVRVNRTPEFLALTNDRKFHVIDMAKNVAIRDLGSAPELGRINMRGQFMILFPENKANNARFVFARDEGETEQSAGDLATGYNNLPPASRGDFVDIHSSGQWNARVFKTKVSLLCNIQNPQVVDVNVPGGDRLTSTLYPNGYDRVGKTVHLMSESGKVYEMGCDGNLNPFVRPSSLVLDQPYKRLLKIGGDTIGLTGDGRLFRVNGSTSTALQTPFDGRVTELVPMTQLEFLDAN